MVANHKMDFSDQVFGPHTAIHDGQLTLKALRTNLAGVTFENDDGVNRQKIIAKCGEGEIVRLVRDRENRHDPNAVRVVRESGDQIGWLPADIAKEIAPVMDREIMPDAVIVEVMGGTKDKPTLGVLIDVGRFADE